jgi:hypothetical protein
MATAPVAAGSLVAGYAVATHTGVRPLGGVVFLAGSAWCARAWSRRHGPAVAALLVGVQVGSFGLSHRLARRLGAWPSVFAAAGLSGAAAAAAGV